jgi:hypothetical protein
VILGKTEPRIFTPPKRELIACTCLPGTCPVENDPEVNDRNGCGFGRTTDGFAAIRFAEKMMGIKLYPWQEWLLKHALELNEDGTYRFRYILVLVARQNGKSLVLLVLALWHLFALGSKEVIATAQDLGRSEAAWKEAVEWCEEDDELSGLIEKVDRGHPKLMEIAADDDIPWKREYRVASAGRRGARGFSGDLVLMDELREHQTWETWGAVTNTMNARPRGQAWAFSNAGDNLSIVLRFLRAQQHKLLGWPDGDGDAEVLGEDDPELLEFLEEYDVADMTGIFEWSADPKSKRTDMEALAQANPSLNHKNVATNCPTDRTLLGGLVGTPPWQYDTEVRCIWVPMSDLGPFPEGSWEETLDDKARPLDTSSQVVCVSVAQNRSRAYIARAGWCEWGDKDDEGNATTVKGPVVGIAADRAGTDWIADWLVEHRATFEYVVIQDKGAPVSSLLAELSAKRDHDGRLLPLLKWTATDVAPGTGIMFDRLEKRTMKHLPHPGLDAAALSAAQKILSRSAFEIDVVKSPTDAQPLQAAIGAVWALEAVPPEVEPQVHEWPSQEEIQQWLEEEDTDDEDLWSP